MVTSTLTPKRLSHTYTRGSVQLMAYGKWKVIIYPDPSCLDNPKYVLCMDLYNPDVYKEVTVSLFPDDGDNFKVMGTHNDTWYILLCRFALSKCSGTRKLEDKAFEP